ncbi:MAG: TRAP transporter small permease subunit, partial [Deltaproteobacteria bacterium]|nr:TRAP transporter small permease subunit [Deltaproteobacteria bacterium]
MTIWNKLDAKIGQVETVLVTILLTVMILMTFAQIVLRNLFATGIDWGDALVRYLVVWLAFVGAAIAT